MQYHIIDELLRPRIVCLVILIVVATIVLHINMKDPDKKEVDFGAVLVSGAGVVYTILLTVQSKRASSAARFAERWNDVNFSERRREVGQVVRREKTIDQIKDQRSITVVLNFFEEMSISIQAGEAQEAMLKKFFRSPVIQSAAVLKPWIEERQKQQPTVFREYLKLVERWKD